MKVRLPSEAGLALFHQAIACPPLDRPQQFTLNLLAAFFSEEELADSCCTKAKGRKLLDQRILLAMKGKHCLLCLDMKWIIFLHLCSPDQLPLPGKQQGGR